jgi:Ferritin-like domain
MSHVGFFGEQPGTGEMDSAVSGAGRVTRGQCLGRGLAVEAGVAATFDFYGVTEDPDAFRRTAVALEDLSVAAYKYEIPAIQSPRYLAAAVGIISVEARHAAWIRRLAGVLPAASAFDHWLAPRQVNSLVASTRFVVAPPRTSAHNDPQFTG